MRFLGLSYAQRLTAGPALLRYLVAVVLFLIALFARLELADALPPSGFPFLTFFPAVLLAAYFAGLGPGLLTSALSLVAAWFFFLGPQDSFQLDLHDVAALGFFTAILLIDCVVIHTMKQSLQRVTRTEQRLRESGDKLRLVLDNLYVYVGLLDLKGTLQEINEAPLRISDLSREELIGKPFWAVSWWEKDPHGQAQVRAAIARAVAGETVRFDLEITRASNPPLTIDFQMAPLFGAGGEVTALVTSGVDISDRVAAVSLAETERRLLDATFNAVPAGIFAADASGKLVRMNKANEQIWGLAPFSPDVDSYGEWKGWWADGSARHGQRIKPHEWGLARSLKGEVCSDLVEVEPFDRPGERVVTLLSSAPVISPTGKVVGGVVSQVDVTDRVNAEQAAIEKQQLLQSTMDNFPTVIAYKDLDGRFIEVNHRVEKMLGKTRETLRGLSMHDFIEPEAAELLRAHDVRVMHTRQAVQTERMTPLESGTVHYLDTSFPLINALGDVYGTGHISHDITDLKRVEAALSAANEQLREADRQKDEFLATLAHELRNPLAPIRTAVEIIRLRDPEDGAVRRARAIIERQVLHLTRLVDDLLDVSRITLGTIQLRHEVLDAGTVTERAIESIRAQADANGLTIAFESDPSHVLVSGDPTRLGQCVLNLLANALKFTPAGGRIDVRVAKEQGTALIEVADTGSGISRSSLDRIFGLFVQEWPSGLHGNTGLGIGLALTRKLVALHGGTVTAFSAGLGQGSTFRIELPIAQGVPVAEIPRLPPRDPGLASVARVLLVEDSHDAAKLLEEFLEISGFEVSAMYDGESALRALQEGQFDAVLLDIGLPDLDGYQVCRRIREMKLPRQPVVIALTGWGTEKDRTRATDAGFDEHLTKPAEPNRIVQLIEDCIALRGSSVQPDA